MQSTPILTVHTANRLLDVLEDFLDKTEANYAMIIERGGSILSELGTIPESADMTIVAALAAGSFAATKELALRIGEQEFTSLHQQGENYQIYMCYVSEYAVLVTIFGNQTTLGLVRFYSGKTVKQLSQTLEESTHQYAAPVFNTRDVERAFGE
jgi:predicted regulator of Ras-like GTPase activity (Roadblock/LC7/MglB family)